MSYLYDVFVSYRRHAEWTPWTRDHVRVLLDAYLTQELPEKPRIFVDEQIEPSADWPHRLGDCLARSRVLLPIFSGDYFNSDWCLSELDLMHIRLGRFPESQLIFPVLGHDGELIPDEIARITPADLRAFRNTDLQRHTPRYELFSEAIRRHAPDLAAAIDSAPAFDSAWVDECRVRFDQVYGWHCGRCAAPALISITRKPRPAISVPRVTP